jgi:hypothetical protein
MAGAKKPTRKKGNKGTATWVPALKSKGKVKKQTKVRKKVL